MPSPSRVLTAVAGAAAAVTALGGVALAGDGRWDVRPELITAVLGALVVAVAAYGARALRHAAAERRALEAELALRSVGDALTGLGNRRAFEDALARDERGILLTLEIDGLGALDDVTAERLQHDVGELIRGRLRSSDVGARIGDGRFAIVAPGADVAGGMTLGFALVDAVRGTATVSVGLSPLDRPDAHADAAAAMAIARRAGGDRLIVA